MTLSNLLRSAAASCALVLAVGACGGSDDASETGAGPASTAGPGSTAKPAAEGTATDKIDVKDFSYKPDPVTVKVGTTVTWTFSDSVDHNVEGVKGAELKKSPDLKSGGTYPFTFTKAGTNEYRCSIHNSMTGKIVVTA